MDSVFVTFDDPERMAIDWLAARYATRAESYKPATIGVEFPTDPATFDVQVELEGAPDGGYPLRERDQVRVICWAPATSRSDVKRLASLTAGLLGTNPRMRPITGRSKVVQDPDTKKLVCWFLAQVKPVGTQQASSA